jgi:hypothetical protein
MSNEQDFADRRAHPRVPASFTLHCRRLGRATIDEDVEVLDISMGGLRIVAPDRLDVGHVLELTTPEADEGKLTGLVVGTSRADGGKHAHIAFTRVGPPALERIAQLVDQHS